METFIHGIPKAELHIHIEGALEPELMFDIAQKNGIPILHRPFPAVRLYQKIDRMMVEHLLLEKPAVQVPASSKEALAEAQ